MATEADLLGAFESHAPGEIRKILAAGVSPVHPIGGKSPIDWLIEMYPRSSQFAECLQVMLDAGATIGDPLLQAVLLDDDETLSELIAVSTETVGRKLSLLSAYTSCRAVTPLHICAEWNSLRCARLLLQHGADVNARAGQDSQGFGGHTPIFHAVNSNQNYCRPAMELLVDGGADLNIRVNMIMWGETMTWETILHDVTPISYAQCGLYRQFHRREEHIYSNIEFLYRKQHGIAPPIRNVPNKYLVFGH